jgi:tRNA-specific 2-thiouridylase
VVGPREALGSNTIVLRDVNWLVTAETAFDCAVKVRSMRPPVAARVTPLPDHAALVELDAAEHSVAPGQACVFYESGGSRVLGGGWIARANSERVAAE